METKCIVRPPAMHHALKPFRPASDMELLIRESSLALTKAHTHRSLVHELKVDSAAETRRQGIVRVRHLEAHAERSTGAVRDRAHHRDTGGISRLTVSL